MNRAQGLPITTIIIAALGLFVLVVIGAIFGGQIGTFGRVAKECPGKCVVANAVSGSPAEFTVRSPATCDAEFESSLSGAWLAKGTPKGQESEHRCNKCCVPTG